MRCRDWRHRQPFLPLAPLFNTPPPPTHTHQIRRFNSIVGRRKKKKDFEYEVQWQGLSSIKFNRWIPRTELVEKGFQKKVRGRAMFRALVGVPAGFWLVERSTATS